MNRSALLELRRNDNAPKCATCANWKGRDASEIPAADCELHHMKTLDLAVCSYWSEHAVLHGDIITPDQAD